MVPTLYEDDDFLVVDKAAGLLSVPGKGPDKQDCLINRVKDTHPHALLVHRLDQPTSGIMAFALNQQAQRFLSRQFEQRLTVKQYEALVWGTPPLDEGEVDLPIRLDVENRPMQIVDMDRGRRSLTGWKVIGREGDLTRVKLFPHTGRTHQLRLHMQSLGCPIAGDRLYSPPEQSELHPRLMLHASYLGFSDPTSESKTIGVFSPVPF